MIVPENCWRSRRRSGAARSLSLDSGSNHTLLIVSFPDSRSSDKRYRSSQMAGMLYDLSPDRQFRCYYSSSGQSERAIEQEKEARKRKEDDEEEEEC